MAEEEIVIRNTACRPQNCQLCDPDRDCCCAELVFAFVIRRTVMETPSEDCHDDWLMLAVVFRSEVELPNCLSARMAEIDPELTVDDVHVDIYINAVAGEPYRTTLWIDRNGWGGLPLEDFTAATILWLVIRAGEDELIRCFLCIDCTSVEDDGVITPDFVNCLDAPGTLVLIFSSVSSCPVPPDEFIEHCMPASGSTGSYMELSVSLEVEPITVTGDPEHGWFGSGGSWRVDFYDTAEDCVAGTGATESLTGIFIISVICAGVDLLGFQVLVRIPPSELGSVYPGPYIAFSGLGTRSVDNAALCSNANVMATGGAVSIG